MKNVYLFAAIAGTIIPYAFFVDFFMTEGIDPFAFISGVFANGAAGGFAADILISSAVFWGYLISKKESRAWVYILLNLTIGLSCALPVYLYVQAKAREDSVSQQQAML